MTSWTIALAAAPLVAWILIAVLRASSVRRWLADHPNERSLHERPTPRIGGLGLLAAALPIAAAMGPSALMATWGAAGGLALVSLLDDVRSLPIEVRLPVHVCAALASYLTVAPMPTSAAGVMLAAAAILALTWMTNLYNFMDGADGLAGGMAIIGFGAYAAAAQLAGDTPMALACAAVAAASLGFLAHNFPPARVFLGDAGAIPLGFLAGTLGLYGVVTGAWPLEFPLLVFSPFIVDATITLARRVARSEPFWKAHRSHHYQRLVLSGWSRRRLAWSAYALMAAAAISALAAREQGPLARSVIISAWAAIYLLLLLAIHRSLRRNAQASATTRTG